MSEPAGNGVADLHAALASVARAIAGSLAVREIWDRVGAAFHTVVPFDAMGIVRLEPGGRVVAVGAAGDLAAKSLEGQVFRRADFSPKWACNYGWFCQL